MNRVGDDLLLAALERQEDYLHEAADAIDVKAGLVLAAAAVLAVQPAVLLIAPKVAKWAFVLQIVSFIVLCIGVWFAHDVLKIEGYESPGFPESWSDEVATEIGDDATEEQVRVRMLWGLALQAEKRIGIARSINNKKLRVLNWSRNCISICFAVNLLLLVAILLTRFCG